MAKIDINDPSVSLPQLVETANSGEEVIIEFEGRPVARLVPMARVRIPRRFGVLKGKIQIAEDFDAPLPADLIAAFEGR